MKNLLFSVLFALSLFSYGQTDTTIGPHKGRLESYTNYKVEVVGCNDYLEVYLYDRKMMPIHNNYGVAGDVKFFYPNEVFSSSPFVHYGADGFTAKIPTPDYMYCRVTATINGQVVTVKFNNECSASVGKQ